MLVPEDGLAAIHEHVVGSDLVCPGPSQRLLRDAELGVRIDVMLTGARLPGKGAPGVVLPHPSEASTVIDGVSCLTLPKLIEMKLAAGMAHHPRLSHLGDVQEMIKKLDLPGAIAEELHPDVRDQYRELWQPVQDFPEEPVEWREWDRGQ